MHRLDRRALARLAAVIVPALAAATLAVAVLEEVVGVPHASAVYLAAVVATALVAGTWGAIGSAVASFLLYNLLFTEPRFTLRIADPGEWLSAILLLFVGVVVGQLTALERSRSEVARAREREARALFRISRELVTRESTAAVLPTIAAILRAEAGMDRVWIALGGDPGRERVAADTGGPERPPSVGLQRVLRRMPGEEPAQWIRVHQAGQSPARPSQLEAYRARLEAGGATFGSIWALRDRARGEPDSTDTRLLAVAADQIGQTIAHDRLAREAQAGEVARQSDALKSALLQSISHDLRTPLATIRTAAGTLRPDATLSVEDRQASVEAIDREVEYLNRLVTNLLDLGRIEGGALRAERDVFELEDLVGRTLDRLRPRLAGRAIDADLAGPPVEVDPVFIDEALTNVLDNVLKHTPPATPIRIMAGVLPAEPFLRVSIEDAGPGVPPDALPRVFEKFYRAPGSGQGSRAGTGIGLAVVRGLVEATGGRVEARPSDLGGLAIDVDLPLAPIEAAAVGGRVS